MSDIKWSGVVENDFTDYDDEPLVKKGDRVYGFLNYFDDVPYILGKIIETDDEYVVVEHWYPVALDSIEVEICGAKISYDHLRELAEDESKGRITGFSDRNGVIIREHDIVRVTFLDRCSGKEYLREECEVIFTQGAFGFMWGSHKEFCTLCSFCVGTVVFYEIIGNATSALAADAGKG